jgi:hypothetical protein
MNELRLSKKASLDGVELEGVEMLFLENCAPECWKHALPASVKKLEISFYCQDVRNIPWKRLPAALTTLHCTRSAFADPVDGAHLQNLTFASFHMCNLRDVRSLLALPALKTLSLEGNPLSPESVAELKAHRKKGRPDFKFGREVDVEYTRRLYDLGINLSALCKGTKKVQLQVPFAPVCQDFPRELVEQAISEHTAGPPLKGQAFIDRVRKLDSAVRSEARAARKAAKAAAKSEPT